MPLVAEANPAETVKNQRWRAVYSALFGGMAQFSKILAGFILLKLVAIYLGVDGMGMLGNFMSLVTFLSLLAGGGIVNGVIKYVAEYKSSPRRMLHFIGAAKSYSLLVCVVVAVGGIAGSAAISEWIFNDSSLQWVIVALSIGQFGFAFTNLVTGTLNGLGDSRAYALVQVTGNFIFIPFAWICIRSFGLEGAALGIIGMFALYTVPAAYLYLTGRLHKFTRSFRIDIAVFRKLVAFSVMAIVGAISVPLVEIFIRQALIEATSVSAAGLWQASLKLSSAYMGFFVMFLAIYLMPLISAEKDKKAITRTVTQFMILLGGIFSVGAIGFYLLRNVLIPLLLSPEFAPLGDLIKLQLMADGLRVVAYVIGFVVVAKAAFKIYVLSEAGQGLMFYFLSTTFIDGGYGVKGVMLANILMNFIYLTISVVGLFYYVRKPGRTHADC